MKWTDGQLHSDLRQKLGISMLNRKVTVLKKKKKKSLEMPGRIQIHSIKKRNEQIIKNTKL